MAGFFAHVPSSFGSYTALPTVTGTSILDSIVADVGVGVNGWTVYDDQRAAGTGTTMIVNVFNQGMYRNATNSVSNSWTAISGTSIIIGDTTVGYNFAYSISGLATNPTDISFDGTNWYTAYYSSWPSNKVQATLDRNYAQTTTFTNKLKTRCRSYIVLQCSSSQKTFYVQIGLQTGSPGGPMLYTRSYETWVTATHTGTVPGQTEVLWAYWSGLVSITEKVQYVLCLYPDVIFMWLNGVTTAYGQNTTMPSSMYIGNLDTTPFRSGTDSDALWAGWSCTAYSGLAINKGDPGDTAWAMTGNGMCLRTRAGSTWAPVTDYHTPVPNSTISPFIFYQFVPRGRTYLEFITGGQLNTQGKFLLSTCDIYQGAAQGAGDVYYGLNQEGPYTFEGVRGELRYLKVPVTNPSGQHMRTVGPMQDGRVYIILRHGPTYWYGAGGNSAQFTADGGLSLAVPSSFARVQSPITTSQTRPLGDLFPGAGAGNVGMWYRFLAMPVL